MGGLLVVPTGKYQQRDETLAMLPILFQIGKGAYSYGLQNMYTLKINNWGINTDYRYIWNWIPLFLSARGWDSGKSLITVLIN